MQQFRTTVESIDWEDYKKWLYNNKNKYYARTLFSGAKKWYHFAFSNELVEFPNHRQRDDILKSITNITRYLDVKYDTNFHDELLQWLKRKEIRWKAKRPLNIPKEVPLETILNNMKSLPEKYRLFSLFALVSGLRTFECVKVLNNHAELCHDGIIEMYWDRVTKKANAVYCHPMLHDKLGPKYHESTIHRNMPSKVLGCQIKYLRKLNFTLVATKLDPLLAEFMQGRRGNVSQKHYFLPMITNSNQKWINLWKPTILKVLKK